MPENPTTDIIYLLYLACASERMKSIKSEKAKSFYVNQTEKEIVITQVIPAPTITVNNIEFSRVGIYTFECGSLDC